MSSDNLQSAYPRLVVRIKGAFIDGIIVPFLAIGSIFLLEAIGIHRAEIKIACAILIILVLEPMAVSLTGGTIGHHILGLRVRSKTVDKRLNVFAALIRFLIKTIFGLPSFFVALLTRNRQALHDLTANSIVIFKSTVHLPTYEVLSEMTRDDEQKRYVSIWRRLLVIFFYWFFAYLSFGLLIAIAFNDCVENKVCSPTHAGGILACLLLMVLGFVVIAVLGWKGKLYGCRKQVLVVRD